MSKNHIVAVDLPPDYHAVWRQSIIERLSPVKSEGKHKGAIVSEIRFYNWRIYDQDEKEFLSCLKTYNNSDHQGGEHRAWKPTLNWIIRVVRFLLFRANPPITPSHPVNTPGHVFIVASLRDKKTKEGREMR